MSTASRDTPHRGLAAATYAALGLAALAGLFLISRYNFLLFHGLAELFSVAVAWSLFLLVWNTRKIACNDALLFLGIAYLCVGAIDLVHTLAFKGMGVFAIERASNTATQLWISARGLEAVSLLVFPLILGRRFSGGVGLTGFTALTAALLGSIFIGGIFPDTYIEGQGLTVFKKGAEYAISLVLMSAMALLYRRRAQIDRAVFRLMMAAIAATVAAELAFTFYVSVYGLSNMAGHLFKIVSFFLVYLALVRSAVTRPHATLFRNLGQAKDALAREGRQLQMLHRGAALFLKSESLEATLADLPALIAAHYEVPGVAIELYDADRQEMVLVGTMGSGITKDGNLRVPVDQTVSGTVATTGRAVVDLDVSKHGDYPAGVLGELNAVTFACVPLIGQEAIIGTLAIADREERPDILDAADLLQVLAGSLAQEIERHQREDAYRLLVETPNTGIIRFDTQGRYLAVNQYVANVLGGRPTEFVGKSLRDVVPDKADLYLERFARIVAEKKGARYEDPFRLPGGTRWFSADLQPVIGPTGDVTGIQVVTLDVTEHKQAYLERESTIRMLEILNASTDLRDLMRSLVYFMQEMSGCKAVGIRLRDGDDFPYYETNGFADDFVAAETHLCVADLDGQVLRDEVGNPVLECMCGNILCGRFDPALPFFTEFGSFVSNGTSQLLARTTEAERQARTRNRCNAEGYESVCLVPLRSGDETFGLLQFNDRREDRFSPQFVAQTERLAGNVAIALSQRKAEETLRKREEQYRAVADNIGDYIMRYDKEGHHIYANRAAIDITGLPVKEYLGKTHREMGFPEQLCALWEKHIRLVFDTGEQQNIAFDVELATGVVSLELQLNPEFSSNGRIESVIGISRDITARKKMEARLQQAQKMESIGDLAGGIAHDFNNILFPIVGMSELLLEDLPPDSIEHQNATEILKAGNRGSDLVKQILAFSRQTEHRMMPIRVQQILKEVYRLVRATIPTNIKIDKNIQADCGLVNADPTQVHQVAMNLITNAYHAVETNTGEIQVALAETELSQDDVSPGALLPGRYALLTVTDTGAGIDPGMMGKIFEPYFTTKGKGKGTGLGLAVVYGIVKEHHGDIVVSSEPGKGTTFSVYLPIIHDIENVAGSEEIALAESEGERILLVDDEVPVAKLEQQMLERLGYRVTSRVSSLEALEAFRENPDAYDMVVTDMAMPNMTGDQFAREVKTIRPEIPILICTGFSERINQVEAEAIGVAGFLMKPIIKSDLAKMVREVLDGVKNH